MFLELYSKGLHQTFKKRKRKLSCNVYDGKEMYKKSVMHVQSCCFANLNLLLFFLPFSLPSPSSLLKLPYRPKVTIIPCKQGAKKVVSDSPGLVDFVLKLPNGQVKFLEEFKLHENCEISSAHQLKLIWGLVEMTFGLVYASFNLPEWQAFKMIFFAPCV